MEIEAQAGNHQCKLPGDAVEASSIFIYSLWSWLSLQANLRRFLEE